MREETGDHEPPEKIDREDAAPAPPGDDAAPGAPETGDLVVDAALRDLDLVDHTDLDGTLAAGEAVHGTLTSRLSDLGS